MAQIVWEPVEPVYGPEKPVRCWQGLTAHTWQLSIEEGQVTLTCDCQLCTDGLWEGFESEDIEMGPIDVKVDIFFEEAGDMSYAYIDVTPDRPSVLGRE